MSEIPQTNNINNTPIPTPTPENENDKSICSQLLNFQTILSVKNNKEIEQISNLLNFLQKITADFDNLYSNYSLYNIKINESEKFLINNFISAFYNYHIRIFENFKKISENIKNEIIPPIKKIKKSFERDSKKTIISLKDILSQLTLHQDVLNNIKKEYYDETEKLELIEIENKKEDSNSQNRNNSQILEKMSNQIKLIENKFSLYKKEVEVMKKLCVDNEKDFNKLKQRIIDSEIKKNNSIFTNLSNYLKIFVGEMKMIYNNNVSLDSVMNRFKVFISNTPQTLNEIFNNNSELNIEWKYDFDISSSNNTLKNNNENNSRKINFEENNNKEKEKNKSSMNLDEMIIMPKNNYEIKGIDINYMELNKSIYEKIKTEDDEDTQKFSSDLLNLNDFFNIICSKNIIESEQKNNIMNILEKYKGNINCYIKFCDIFIDSNINKTKDIFEFQSFSNFAFFSNLLKNIIDNISHDLLSNNINSYKLFDKIICIGEKSMYEDSYLCGLLSSENHIFENESIWKNSIKNKLINLFDEICKKELIIDKDKDPNYFKKSKDIFLSVIKVMGNGTKEKTKNNIIENYGLDKNIKIYKHLNSEKIKNINNDYGQIVLHEIIKCYIRHMINYNFLNYYNNQIQVKEFINNILNDFSINDNNNNKFFNLYFSSYIYSIKKPKPNKKQKLKKMPNQFNENEIDKNKIFILKNALKFLDQKDKINLINLSKKYGNINNYIFKQILKKDDDFNSNKRIFIWKILLNYKESIKKNNYKKILEEVNKIPFNEKEGSDFLIMVDIKRTKFKNRENNGQKILCNLLRCLVYNNNSDDEKINYCQGMNFITALFFDIIRDEEETFHLLKSFFINGKFGIIFKNGLSKLKDYFIILEKMIYLFLPKIYHKLIVNQIQVSFFSSPYFVTLFANIYYFHQENANIFLLHSLDDFILNGWCSIFSTIICILKYFEKKILQLNGEELIKFMVNDIGKCELFTNENYNIYYKLKKRNWIKRELLECLEEEIKIEKDIKEELSNSSL